MKITKKLIALCMLITCCLQLIWAAPVNAGTFGVPGKYLEGQISKFMQFQTIEIPEGILPFALILIPLCGGALLIGVLVIVLLIRQSKKNKPAPVPPPGMGVTPTMTPVQPNAVSQAPEIIARCPNCGANVSARAKFCNYCGTPLAAPQLSPQQNLGYASPQSNSPAPNLQPANQSYSPTPPPNAAYAQNSEPIVGIIAGLAEQKAFSAKQFNLVVTQQRLIFAHLTQQMLKSAMDQSKQEAKAEGRGFFGQWGAMFKANEKVCERYYQMPVDMIIRENPENFVIYPQQIKRVRIQHSNSMDDTDNVDRLVIHSASKMTYMLKGTNARDARQILRQVLGSLVK